MRRAELPLAHSSGFSPRPLMSFGLALPTGCASRAEYLDLRLDAASSTGDVAVVRAEDADRGELARLAEDLSALLPDGDRRDGRRGARRCGAVAAGGSSIV